MRRMTLIACLISLLLSSCNDPTPETQNIGNTDSASGTQNIDKNKEDTSVSASAGKAESVTDNPLHLETIPINLKPRPYPHDLKISDIVVEEYSLSGKDGKYFAPAVTFNVSGGVPDYYVFKICETENPDSCTEGLFGEEGEALCGIQPGKYQLFMQACFDRLWGKKGGCSEMYKARNPFIVKESASRLLQDKMTEQCQLRSQIRKKSVHLYSEIESAAVKSKTNDIQTKNCSVIMNQIKDWGPHSFAHRLGFYGAHLTNIAGEQFQKLENQTKKKNGGLSLTGGSRADQNIAGMTVCYENTSGTFWKLSKSKKDGYVTLQNSLLGEEKCLGVYGNGNTYEAFMEDCSLNESGTFWKLIQSEKDGYTRLHNSLLGEEKCLGVYGDTYEAFMEDCSLNESGTFWKLIQSEKDGYVRLQNSFLGEAGCLDTYPATADRSQSLADMIRGKGHPLLEKINFLTGVAFIAAGGILAYGSIDSFLSLQNPYRLTSYKRNENGEITKLKTESFDKKTWKELNATLTAVTDRQKITAENVAAESKFLSGEKNASKAVFGRSDVGERWFNESRVTVYEGDTKTVYEGTDNVRGKKLASVAGLGASIGMAVFGAWFSGAINLVDSQQHVCLAEPEVQSFVTTIQNDLIRMDEISRNIENLLIGQ